MYTYYGRNLYNRFLFFFSNTLELEFCPRMRDRCVNFKCGLELTMLSSTPRSRFRPCIDLHDGQVKQIVGGTLSESDPTTLKTNFVATCVNTSRIMPATDRVMSLESFAQRLSWRFREAVSRPRPQRRSSHKTWARKRRCSSGGAEGVARFVLEAFALQLQTNYDRTLGGLQVGGGIDDKNALKWIELGASKVIPSMNCRCSQTN